MPRSNLERIVSVGLLGAVRIAGGWGERYLVMG